MRVKVLGSGSFYGPHKVMMSVGPNTVLDVDDSDREAVEFWQARVDGGAAELLDAPAPAQPPTPKPAPAKAVKTTKK